MTTPAGNLLDGRFTLPATPDGVLAIHAPGDLDDHVGDFPWSLAHVDEAIAAARRAQPAWAALPQSERNEALRRIKAELQKREGALADAITREVGKPRWESATEVKAVLAKVDVTLDEGLKLIAGFVPSGLAGECRFRPHGLLAVIGPFNFPAHLPNGHILPALAAGNAVLFKPSEVAPGVGQLYAEALHAAGLPAGVFQMVQGARAVGERLSTARGIDGVLFTGSHAVGSAIQAANANQPGKLLALELGGKNGALVCADADLDKALHDTLFSAYVSCGQRCTATSRVFVHESLVERFTERMVALVKGLTIGAPTRADVFMGPLATAGALDRFLLGTSRAVDDGAEVLLASARLEQTPRGHYVSPGLHRLKSVLPDAPYQRDELFGPDLAIGTFSALEEGLAHLDATPYGLAAAVFTKERATFDHAAARLNVGVVNWNAPTVGASSRLPFGGTKNSGNHRPAGLFSTLYCAWPQALMHGPATLDPRTVAPGVNWS